MWPDFSQSFYFHHFKKTWYYINDVLSLTNLKFNDYVNHINSIELKGDTIDTLHINKIMNVCSIA